MVTAEHNLDSLTALIKCLTVLLEYICESSKNLVGLYLALATLLVQIDSPTNTVHALVGALVQHFN